MAKFAFGKHGQTLRVGPKTKGVVAYEKARKVFDDMVKERLGKGYWPEGEGPSFIATGEAKRHSGISPQLLNEISADEAAAYIADPAWVAQEKKDGDRRLLRKLVDGDGATTVEAINKKGFVTGLLDTLDAAARATPGTFVIDGELVGGILWVFDILEADGVDLRGRDVESRLRALEGKVGFDDTIRIVPTAFTAAEKQALFDSLMAEDREGIVFKRSVSQYVGGRPGSGGNQLKCKFWSTLSAVVDGQNDKRSVSLRLVRQDGDDVSWVGIGNVTIPVNHEVPGEGSVVEVRYLYAYDGGSIYQPTYLGVRSDVSASECGVEQLKFKAA